MRNKQDESLTILRFNILTTKTQDAILEKVTARHTFTVREYLKLIEEREEFIQPVRITALGKLYELTIKTRNRSSVPNDFKELTKLNTVDLESCAKTALGLWRNYLTHLKKWSTKRDNFCRLVATSMLTNFSITPEREINCNPKTESVVEDFSQTRLWRKLQKNKPSLPCQSQQTRNKKIPVFLRYNTNLLPYEKKRVKKACKFENGKLTVKISTLRKGNPIELELKHGEYQLRKMENGRITGGILYKNKEKNRWEFHASIRKEVLDHNTRDRRKAIIGIDLGQIYDVTMVVLEEGEKLKQKNIHFFKEGDIRRKKFNLQQRTKVLQKITKRANVPERRQAYKELRNVSGKIRNLTKEACHRITSKMAKITEEFVNKGFEVHIAVGRLKGILTIAQKGNGKGRKYRGRLHRFPFHMLTEFISYKCKEVGVKTVAIVSENWTSKMCHRCDSKNTTRLFRSLFKCFDCDLQYNADLNGAINIAYRFWLQNACAKCNSLNTKKNHATKELTCIDCNFAIMCDKTKEMNSKQFKIIFLSHNMKSKGTSKSLDLYSKPHGTNDTPTCTESTGTATVHLKVEEARKRERILNSQSSYHSNDAPHFSSIILD